MRRRLRLPRCPRRATASHAWPRRARLARNCRFGSFRRARLRPALSFVRITNRMQSSQPNRLHTSHAGLVGLHAGNQTRPGCLSAAGCIVVAKLVSHKNVCHLSLPLRRCLPFYGIWPHRLHQRSRDEHCMSNVRSFYK